MSGLVSHVRRRLAAIPSLAHLWPPTVLAQCSRGFHASAAAHKAQELETLADFDSMMRSSGERPVVLDFYATWCGPCKEMLPRLEAAIDRTNGKVRLFKLNIDKQEFTPLLSQVKVQSVPTLMAIFGAKMLDAKIGAMPPRELDDWIAKIAAVVPDESPQDEAPQTDSLTPEQQVDRAYALLEGGPRNVSEVALLLAAAVDKASGALKARALAGLARCSLLEDPPNVASARELVQGAEALASGSDDVASASAWIELTEAALRDDMHASDGLATSAPAATRGPSKLHALALRQFLGGDVARAVDTGLEIVRHHRAWEDGRGKATVLTFLKALGPRHPEAVKGRKRLSNLLFV